MEPPEGIKPEQLIIGDATASVNARAALSVRALPDAGTWGEFQGELPAAGSRIFFLFGFPATNLSCGTGGVSQGGEPLSFLASQLRQVMRRLGRAPMFTAITLVTLAAGVGASTAVFSVLEGVVLKPLPYPYPEHLVGVWHTAPGLNWLDVNMAPSNYFVYRDQNRTFQSLGMYRHDSVTITGVAEPEQVPALDVTDGVLETLGVPPLIGRWFTRQDDTPGAPETAILLYGYWQHKFGGSPSVMGRTILVDGKQRQIVGVMPRRFRFLNVSDTGLLLPLQLDPSKTFLGNFSFEGLARLKPGATLKQANADVARMLPIVMRSFSPPPGFSLDLLKKARIAPNVHPLEQDVVGNVVKLLWVLMGSMVLVLLIACANVANLLLVRAEGRQQELTVRAALGASRVRIAGELLLESAVIGIIGGALGLGIAWGGLRLLLAMAPAGLPRLADIGIDVPVLLFALLISLLAGLLFGCIPVLKYAGAHAGTGLREGGRTLSQSRERHRARNALVIVQAALAFVLLVCSGLMIRTFRALTQVNPGFVRPADVQTFRLEINDSDVSGTERVLRVQEQILRKIAAIPGVSSAGMTSTVPMDGNSWIDPIYAEDHSYSQGQLPPLRRFVMVSPGYFQTMGIPLVAGRDLTWAESYNKTPVTIVSEKLAREYWGEPEMALGKRIRVANTDDWREIIGVVGDVHDEGMDKAAPADVYWPILRVRFEGDPKVEGRRYMAYAIRSPRAGSQTFLKEVRQAVWSVDANLPPSHVHKLDYFSRQSMARTSFTLVMLGIAGAMALLLGTVGLYGVIAYSVSQRTREIGIRIALGARRQELTAMFVRQGLRLTGVGIIGGLAAAFAAMRLLSSLLFNVSPFDPATYAAVTVALAATALLASYLPSRQAQAVDPIEALRAE
ncbi:MAG TPA: ABC transporter permease [Candidatus Acidoferrales bacterium]|nr:ABC transporter permease [Candidatus Acidoferrales bacterium]